LRKCDAGFGALASFNAVCCFVALYLIEQPMYAVDELVRVLAPTGRLALLSSCSRGPLPAGVTSPLVKVLTSVHMFSREEITDALAARGARRLLLLGRGSSPESSATTSWVKYPRLGQCSGMPSDRIGRLCRGW
jgi:hypothetical protein